MKTFTKNSIVRPRQVYEMHTRKPIRREITHTLQLSHAEQKFKYALV